MGPKPRRSPVQSAGKENNAPTAKVSDGATTRKNLKRKAIDTASVHADNKPDHQPVDTGNLVKRVPRSSNSEPLQKRVTTNAAAPSNASDDPHVSLDVEKLDGLCKSLSKLSGEIEHIRAIAKAAWKSNLKVEEKTNKLEDIEGNVDNLDATVNDLDNKVDGLATSEQADEILEKVKALATDVDLANVYANLRDRISRLDEFVTDRWFALSDRLERIEDQLASMPAGTTVNYYNR